MGHSFVTDVPRVLPALPAPPVRPSDWAQTRSAPPPRVVLLRLARHEQVLNTIFTVGPPPVAGAVARLQSHHGRAERH
jgi:hypothetical protein